MTYIQQQNNGDLDLSKYNPIQNFQALLEMIEPSNGYKGGSLSHYSGKEFLDFHLEYVKLLEEVLAIAQFGIEEEPLVRLDAFQKKHKLGDEGED